MAISNSKPVLLKLYAIVEDLQCQLGQSNWTWRHHERARYLQSYHAGRGGDYFSWLQRCAHVFCYANGHHPLPVSGVYSQNKLLIWIPAERHHEDKKAGHFKARLQTADESTSQDLSGRKLLCSTLHLQGL